MRGRDRDASGWADWLVPAATASVLLVPLGLAGWTDTALPAGTVPAVLWAGCIAGLLSLAGARARHRMRERLSRDITFVSERLIAVESRLADLEHRRGPERKPPPELAGDVALLGTLVGDLADTLAQHDADILGLKAAPRHGGLRSRDVSVEAPRPPAKPPEPVTPWLMPDLSIYTRAQDTDGDAELVVAFEAGRIELLARPIVTLPQRRPSMAEMSGRLVSADGRAIGSDTHLAALGRAGLSARYDRAMLARAVAHLRENTAGIVSLSLSPSALRDPAFLDELVRADQARPLGRRLILEVAETGWRDPGSEEEAVRALVRERGIAFCLHAAPDLRLDAAALAGSGIGFVKIASDLLLAPGREDAVAALVGRLDAASIASIATGVDVERSVPELIELGVALAVGDLFAKAIPVALRPADPGPEAVPVNAPPAVAVPPQRMSLRDFLRNSG